MTMHGKQVCDQWDLVQFSDSGVSPFNGVQFHCTVKKNRNFKDPVMGNCDKKSTGNREFTGNCPYILYINSQFTVLLRIFCKFTGN